ncbi:MAG: UMP kinase [Rhodobiaceae bacterium]|nr:UMP kinase [Rhodobiaceae bacterium]MCC0041307.1 UMP kinase [Rhodobiaceae bacterium]
MNAVSGGKRDRRVLLKLSGEALMGNAGHGIDVATVARFASDIAAARQDGVEIAIVVGGGNIFRGLAASASGLDRTTADSMGMLATVMNALALAGALNDAGCPAVAMSAIPMDTVCEAYARRRAVAHLAAGTVVVFAGGTGNPYFTTDTAAVLRAAETDCDAVYKATQVDGIYSADPKKVADAVRYDTLTYDEVLARNLQVMDAAAIAIARDNTLPIVVFSVAGEGAISNAIAGKGRSTRVSV